MSILSQPWTHHQPQPHAQDARSYHTRVRRRVFLWGSAGLHHDVRFSPAPVLHLWNDVFGTPIVIGTRKADGQERELGTLQPGEHFAVELHDICGVYAECHHESRVDCVIYR